MHKTTLSTKLGFIASSIALFGLMGGCSSATPTSQDPVGVDQAINSSVDQVSLSLSGNPADLGTLGLPPVFINERGSVSQDTSDAYRFTIEEGSLTADLQVELTTLRGATASISLQTLGATTPLFSVSADGIINNSSSLDVSVETTPTTRTVRIRGALFAEIYLLHITPVQGQTSYRWTGSFVASGECIEGIQDSGALYRLCFPSVWNGGLVLFARGYIDEFESLRLPNDQVAEGLSIGNIANILGFGYGTTSISANGFASAEGIADINDLVTLFQDNYGEPNFIYPLGGSQGGLVTTLLIERFPQIYDGGVALCGPIGDMRRHINYLGDTRLLFDYYFPGVLPGDVLTIPQELIDNWDSVYLPRIKETVEANPDQAIEILDIVGGPYDLDNPETIFSTFEQVIRFNVFGLQDLIKRSGGIPYDNQNRWYRPASNPIQLNRDIERYRADVEALLTLDSFTETTGIITRPLVTLHTTGDPQVSYVQEGLYQRKLRQQGSKSLHRHFPADVYGHCNFTAAQLLFAFNVLIRDVTGQALINIQDAFPSARSEAEYRELNRRFGTGL